MEIEKTFAACRSDDGIEPAIKSRPIRSRKRMGLVTCFALLAAMGMTGLGPVSASSLRDPGEEPSRRGGPGGFTGGDQPDNWTYVAVGLQPAWDTEGVELLRGLVEDDDLTGGLLIHPAQAGGGLGVDAWSGVIQLPFFFELYGVPYDRFCVSKSGLLTFDISVADSPVFIQGQAGGWALDSLATASSKDGGTIVIGGLISPGQGTAGDIPLDEELGSGSGGSNAPLGLPHPDVPNNTIAYFWGQFLPLGSGQDIYMFVYGDAPDRQVWVINAGHRKKGNLQTYTAVVLEETTNRILVLDMSTSTDADQGFLTVGVQRDPATARQILASPNIPVVGESPAAGDNAFYLLQPYRRYQMVSGVGHPNLDAIDTIIFDLLDQKNIPGATAAASQDGRLLFAKGFGFANVETGVAMQPFHRAGIGSVSKVLTTLGVMKLVELTAQSGKPVSLDDFLYGTEGLLAEVDYEDNIAAGIDNGIAGGEYEPGSELYWDGAYHSIRLRHLLTHTAGFHGGGDPDEAAELFGIDYTDVTYSDVHRHFLETEPLLSPPPGTPLLIPDPDSFAITPPEPARAYSNHGFGLCGHVIEAVSGIAYSDFMQAYVYSPLDLFNIIYTPVQYADLNFFDSKRYNYYQSGLPYHYSSFDGSRVYGAYGYKRGDLGAASGGWVTTARDLVRLLCATDQLANHSDILPPELLDEMESVPFPEISAGQAHGWSKAASGKLAKNGRAAWCAAYMAKYPSGINVAIVINTGASSDLLRIRANLVEDIVAGAEVPPEFDLFVHSALSP